MKDLEIMIKPTFDSTRESMDYTEYDDYDSDAILFQQGYDMDVIVVSPGETFNIDTDFIGEVNCDEIQYKLKTQSSKEYDEDYELQMIELKSGKYQLLKDGITIMKL